MAAIRLLACSRAKPSNLAAVFRAHDSFVTSVLLIQTRTKFSKTSPFARRKNPIQRQRENTKDPKGAYIERMSVDRRLDRPIIIDSPGVIFSDYLPIRKHFFLTPWGLKERWKAFKNGLWTVYSLALVRKYAKPFNVKDFAQKAQEIYIDVNKALASKSKKDLQDVVTNPVYSALSNEYFPPEKNLHWRFVSAVSRPKVVHVRVAPVATKDNLFAQITVKIHSKQVMAIKDKHGRHITGSDKEAKDVVDYVVFERHLTNKHGTWRTCGKLLSQPGQKTNAVQQLAKHRVPSISVK
ncbi:39S ribosomal protein L45, mitochondrial [Desmophyllum pertusum]|uniref:Large ribosomal subunit protein mL45 n=1 Tax=Desmophyllum pertusum TaxID=174260 RepID=A0A9X0CPK4_9CNID|nr:39S ribosomal protein L45, mitochondrial [Desmophyllum pertusum]